MISRNHYEPEFDQNMIDCTLNRITHYELLTNRSEQWPRLLHVLSKFTGQATPALAASNQVWAHTPAIARLEAWESILWNRCHQIVTLRLGEQQEIFGQVQHTTCEPRSLASVLQHPSRYQPVIGSVEHGWSSVPLTLTLGCMLLRRVWQS